MLRSLLRPKTALRSLLLLCFLATAVSAFAQDELLEIEQNDIPGLAGLYEIPGSIPPKLMVMIKYPDRAGTEIPASDVRSQNLVDLPSPAEILEIYDAQLGGDFGSNYYLKSPDGTLIQSAAEAVQYRFVNYSITELYAWRDIIVAELPKTFDWISGAGILPLQNRLLLVVDTREADFDIVREEVEAFLNAQDIPRGAVRLAEGYAGKETDFRRE